MAEWKELCVVTYALVVCGCLIWIAVEIVKHFIEKHERKYHNDQARD